jgi:hypothetical protein
MLVIISRFPITKLNSNGLLKLHHAGSLKEIRKSVKLKWYGLLTLNVTVSLYIGNMLFICTYIVYDMKSQRQAWLPTSFYWDELAVTVKFCLFFSQIYRPGWESVWEPVVLDKVKFLPFLELNRVHVPRSQHLQGVNCVRKYEVSCFQFIAFSIQFNCLKLYPHLYPDCDFL